MSRDLGARADGGGAVLGGEVVQENDGCVTRDQYGGRNQEEDG